MTIKPGERGHIAEHNYLRTIVPAAESARDEAVAAASTAAAEAAAGVAPTIATQMATTGTVVRNALDRALGTLDASVYGADPTGATDSTAGIQAAVDAAIAGAVGTVMIPPGTYRIDGTVTIPSSLHLTGAYTSVTSPTSRYTRMGGTVLVATAGTAGAPVLHFTGDTFAYGLCLSNLMILGSNHFNTATGAVDRVAVKATDIFTEASIERVNVSGFLRQAFLFEGVSDGHMIGCRVMKCGTDGTYPAIELKNGASVNTNALHAFGCHFEANPYTLLVNSDTRHVQFVACKFEMYSVGPAASPIVISGAARENAFVGCQFVQRNADDSTYYPTDTQPAFIQVTAGTVAMVLISGGIFSTQPYSPPGNDMGSRWINQLGGRVIVTGCEFGNAYAAGVKPIVLGDDSIFTNNIIHSRAKSATRNVLQMGSRCKVTNNTIVALDTDAITVESALFTATGTGNVLTGNTLPGTYYAVLSGSAVQDWGPDARLGAPCAAGSYWAAGPALLGTGAMLEGNERAIPFTTGRPCMVDKLAASVTVVGSAGAVLRFGIRADNGAGAPGSLLVDGGTVVADVATGVHEVTITPFPMLPGVRYWLTLTAQGGATTRPTIRQNVSVTPLAGPGSATAATALDAALTGMSAGSTAAGALPATNTWAATANAPRLAVHVSA